MNDWVSLEVQQPGAFPGVTECYFINLRNIALIRSAIDEHERDEHRRIATTVITTTGATITLHGEEIREQLRRTLTQPLTDAGSSTLLSTS